MAVTGVAAVPLFLLLPFLPAAFVANPLAGAPVTAAVAAAAAGNSTPALAGDLAGDLVVAAGDLADEAGLLTATARGEPGAALAFGEAAVTAPGAGAVASSLAPRAATAMAGRAAASTILSLSPGGGIAPYGGDCITGTTCACLLCSIEESDPLHPEEDSGMTATSLASLSRPSRNSRLLNSRELNSLDRRLLSFSSASRFTFTFPLPTRPWRRGLWLPLRDRMLGVRILGPNIPLMSPLTIEKL